MSGKIPDAMVFVLAVRSRHPLTGSEVCHDQKRLSVPKNRNRFEIAAFSNRKVLNRRLCRRNRRKIARKSPEKIADTSLAILWAAE